MLNEDHEILFAVNTESSGINNPATETFNYDCNEGSISSFNVAADGTLTFVQKMPSGGLFPDSLTVHGSLLYVLNAGGGVNTACTNFTTPNITGFKLSGAIMTPLSGSTQSIDGGALPFGFLNCDNAAPGAISPFTLPPVQCGLNPPAFPRSPGEVKFTPKGKQIVVTDKGPNKIYVFPVLKDGTPGTPTIFKATGPSQPTYYGFNFDAAGHLIVSEPFGSSPVIGAGILAGAVSSFSIGTDGSLTPISSSVPNGQGTSCWVALDPATYQTYAYISNNTSPTLSSYNVGSDGSLTLLADTAATVALPNDLAVALDTGGSFLYVVQSGTSNATIGTVGGTVGVFQINADGSLTRLQQAAGLPVNSGAQGLAAY
jgi:6-phosphogluconolactonase